MGKCKVIRYRNPKVKQSKKIFLLIRNKIVLMMKPVWRKGKKRVVSGWGRGPISLSK